MCDVLGHPLDAPAWLADDLRSRGQHLKTGQGVLTGSTVKTVWLKRGDTVRMGFTEPGAVEAAFR